MNQEPMLSEEFLNDPVRWPLTDSATNTKVCFVKNPTILGSKRFAMFGIIFAPDPVTILDPDTMDILYQYGTVEELIDAGWVID